jgi:hypothetical protein
VPRALNDDGTRAVVEVARPGGAVFSAGDIKVLVH